MRDRRQHRRAASSWARAGLWRAAALGVALATGASGCNALRRLRAFFHPDGAGDGSSLVLRITPEERLRIVLDGQLAGQESPFRSGVLAAGAHLLTIEAEGHFPFALPLTIAEDDSLEVAVALRPRPTEAAAPVVPRSPITAAPMPPAPEAPAPPLPRGVPPISLHVAGEPSATVKVDTVASGARVVTLERVYGLIEVGNARVKYRIGGSGTLELTLPDDGTQWFRDGEPQETGASFELHRGATRLQQITSGGESQTVYLKR